jgi:membrane protein
MKSSIFKILAETFRRFNDDKCWNSAIIISYFTFMCAIPLIALFAYITTKILGSSEIAFRSLNLFTEEFFAKMDPGFFQKIQAVSKNITNLGLFGLLGSLIAASFLFSNLIYTLNFIFRANYRKSFFYNRLMEYVIMVTMGIIMLFSLASTAFWTALHRTIRGNDFVDNFINPDVLRFVDSFLVQYLIPYALTFLVLFSLYKLIPEVRVHTASAAIAASICAVLWEIFKRIFAFYVAHFSAIGIVLSKLVQGTLTSIIFFLLWISFSLVILLWGAELAAVLNERRHAHVTPAS